MNAGLTKRHRASEADMEFARAFARAAIPPASFDHPAHLRLLCASATLRSRWRMQESVRIC